MQAPGAEGNRALLGGFDGADQGADAAAVDDGRPPEIQDHFPQALHFIQPAGESGTERHGFVDGQPWRQLEDQDAVPGCPDDSGVGGLATHHAGEKWL